MSLSIFASAPFGNGDAWASFVLAHFLRHETIRSSVKGQVTFAKLDDIKPGDSSWMLGHAQEHQDICDNLGIQSNPYIGETDLTDATLYEQWMYQHRLEHDQFDLNLGL